MRDLVLLAGLALGLAGFTSAGVKNYEVGQRTLHLADPSRGREWAVEVWYPTTVEPPPIVAGAAARQIFKPWRVAPEAPIAEGRFPLLVFSHGTGGDRHALAWLMEQMVQQGYVGVSLDHYGNNHSHKIPREFLKWWERAIDVQFVLTEILADSAWSPHIDPTRIGGVGHSLGGYTMIALAGGQVDRLPPGLPNTLPPEFPETDEPIDYATDPEIVASYQRWNDQVKDERFHAFFVMAPAIGFGFHREEHTADIDRPISIVCGEGDGETPAESNAVNFHRRIPTSELHLFPAPVGHYVFLNEATELGRQVAPFICVDPPGVDRAKIHAETAARAIPFFEQSL